ncbi:MAG: hypothetical protein IJ079_09290 [Lachnospiraceae bacterium]|nr:hypothetical protein [Lachnospiraceae bacterium]
MVTKDFYEEKGVVAKPNKKGAVAMWVMLAVAILAFVIAILMQNFIPLVVTLATGSVFVTMFREHYVEYDYCFFNEEIDVTKIMNRKRRKTAISFNVTNIRFVAPLGSIRLSNHMEQYPGIRITDYTSLEPKDPVYGFVLDLRGINTIIYMEPTEAMMNHLRNMIPDKIVKE